MMQRVKSLAKAGTTVLYTEHNMDAVFGVADRVMVLMEGRLVAQGKPQDVAANALVRERYLGTSLDSLEFSSHA
jgi:branched-chain amino acid transport system ATP-binding protein